VVWVVVVLECDAWVCGVVVELGERDCGCVEVGMSAGIEIEVDAVCGVAFIVVVHRELEFIFDVVA